jgi:hypothetical protein
VIWIFATAVSTQKARREWSHCDQSNWPTGRPSFDQKYLIVSDHAASNRF